jgi:hypothetical protein
VRRGALVSALSLRQQKQQKLVVFDNLDLSRDSRRSAMAELLEQAGHRDLASSSMTRCNEHARSSRCATWPRMPSSSRPKGLNVYDVLKYKTLLVHPKRAPSGSQEQVVPMSKLAGRSHQAAAADREGHDHGRGGQQGPVRGRDGREQDRHPSRRSSKLYDVDRACPSTPRWCAARVKRVGRNTGKRRNWKRAIVKLDQRNIDFFGAA